MSSFQLLTYHSILGPAVYNVSNLDYQRTHFQWRFRYI